MALLVKQEITASRERVWDIITDIENSANTISAITDLTVLERPESGLLGFKWTETRTMFGRDASETMWITAVEDGKWYEASAASHGAEYLSRLEIQDAGDAVELSMSFQATPISLLARIMSISSVLFYGSMKKAFLQDLQDIKRVAES